MLARLEKPLRLTAAVRMALAKPGGLSLQLLAQMSHVRMKFLQMSLLPIAPGATRSARGDTAIPVETIGLF
jgi:hypothetical protein